MLVTDGCLMMQSEECARQGIRHQIHHSMPEHNRLQPSFLRSMFSRLLCMVAHVKCANAK